MRARIWGTRGTLATPGAETLRYGGNTSCVELRVRDGTLIVLDAGTGIRPLGVSLGDGAPATIHLLLTHLHLDHIEGFGFFQPLWRAETRLHVWGPPSPFAGLRERISRFLSPPFFPLPLADVPSEVTFHDVPDEPWEIGGARVRAERIVHPGPTVGYRVEEDGRALAYMPDHEPALALDLETVTPDWISGRELAAGADVLVHDAQYSEAEYSGHVGWGHSSVAHAVRVAEVAEVGRLLLFHHDPLHGDGELAALELRAQELWRGNGPPPELAHEGMELEV